MQNDHSNITTAPPKRVAGGIGLVLKKKRKRIQSAPCNPCRSTSSIPSILTSLPDNTRALSSQANENSMQSKSDDEFGGDSLIVDAINDSATNDTLLCLRASTRPTNGMPSETCAYCPIFTMTPNNNNTKNVADSGRSSSTHAAPFLPKKILLHLSSNHAQTNEDIKQLAAANKIRLIQLHGTAIARNGMGWRGDGNDDEDIAVMETCAYEIAAKMALDAHLDEAEAEYVHKWFVSLLLPKFTRRSWILSLSLEDFIESTAERKIKSDATKSLAALKNSTFEQRWSVKEMNNMVKDLVNAGLLMPRRGLGLNGGEGYWFSLPGLGRAAKSIADGRLSIVRRIQSSQFKEKKRAALEQEVGRPNKKEVNTYVQSGKFLVLDLLAKGVVYIHESCTGEQFVRIKD